MWDKVKRDTKEFISTEAKYWSIDENAPVPETSDVIWLKRVVNETKPDFNPVTQRLVRVPVDDYVNNTRTLTYQAVSLTQSELDAKEQIAQDAVDKTTILAVLNAMDNGQGTVAERLVRNEKVLVKVARRVLR